MGCGEQVTNWYYFIQSSFAFHSLHFELSHISLSVSLDSFFVSFIFASVFNHRPCPRVHSSPVHDFMMHSFVVRKASPEGYLFQASGVSKGS